MLKMLLAVSILILYSGCNSTTPEPEICEPVVKTVETMVPVPCKYDKIICGKLHGTLDEQLGQVIICLKKHKVEMTRCSDSK